MDYPLFSTSAHLTLQLKVSNRDELSGESSHIQSRLVSVFTRPITVNQIIRSDTPKFSIAVETTSSRNPGIRQPGCIDIRHERPTSDAISMIVLRCKSTEMATCRRCSRAAIDFAVQRFRVSVYLTRSLKTETKRGPVSTATRLKLLGALALTSASAYAAYEVLNRGSFAPTLGPNGSKVLAKVRSSAPQLHAHFTSMDCK